MVTINSKSAFCIVNIYGWTNGHECTATATRTDALFANTFDELAHLPPLPTMFVGDFNADIADLPTVQRLIDLDWTDLGEKAVPLAGVYTAQSLHE